MKKPKIMIPTGFGLNCDDETHYASEQAGGEVILPHLNDLYQGNVVLREADILVFGGGFSRGDEGGAGVVEAAYINDKLHDPIRSFIRDGGLVFGICNGFQILVNLGLLPGFDKNYEDREVNVTFNDSVNFRDQWVSLYFNQDSPCVFTKGTEYMNLPIRHGEGKLAAEASVLEKLAKNKQVAVQYCLKDSRLLADGKFPDNPNGSPFDIAGICDETGRVFGMMPHPEAYNHVCNAPDWTEKKYYLQKHHKGPINKEVRKGEGIRLFENAVKYVNETR